MTTYTKAGSDGLCESCHKNEATDPHECPYRQDVYGDQDPEYCTCCESCQQECAYDI